MPAKEYLHPELGRMAEEEQLWSGQVERNGRIIPFCVKGTDSEPDLSLANCLIRILNEVIVLEEKAKRFVCPPEAFPVQPEDFTLQSINLLWPRLPNHFTLEFSLDRDPGAIWRVEFENWEPKYTGRDD